ncbi:MULTISPECIES: DUF2975 domain-containing protein [unclassified Beijerinckia]|uniref:DUF2975 domain-containing protein n=1 Tax=unclassified Beijerinckia TaxID=2638183 RepID=UPI00089BA58E|nr:MULTISPECIES: DUF2975 domain-containing protein [unclassified Beijerinckia]MDH7795438.1 hypothetical protein [Beijerinckia sp. GAS462]SEC01587.1 Protein of unknown function [Beijerinckia sp. 28-YEA-48]
MSAEAVSDTVRSQRLARIRRLSRLLVTACTATSVLLTLALLFYWATTPTPALLRAQAGVNGADTIELGFVIRALAFLISMVPLSALIYGLMNARQCFAAFAAGHIFSAETAGRLRNFAVAIIASAVLKPFAGAALSVLLSWHGSPGTKSLVFNVGSDTLLGMIFGGTVALIAWVMREAMTIADENAQFI